MKLKMDKDLLLKVLCLNCSILLVLTLILTVCLVHSCSANLQSDYDYDYDYDRDDDDDDENEDLPNGKWVDLEDPSDESQTVTIGLGSISDKIEFRINNHSKYIDAVTTINGKNVTTEGGTMKISSSYVGESNTGFGGQYRLSGKNLYNAEFQITPCKQDSLGIYSITIGDFIMEIQVMDCKSILFDRRDGITLKGVTGEWNLYVTPARGDAIEIAYEKIITVKATSDETSDISISWLTNGMRIEASEKISSLKARPPVIYNWTNDEETYVHAAESKDSYNILVAESENDTWGLGYIISVE